VDLTDRIVIVTGAAHGLGRAYALAAGAAGANVSQLDDLDSIVSHRYSWTGPKPPRAAAGDGPPGSRWRRSYREKRR
jgi:NAD(P)-dependent dehydrogenase (short-subunit alcohol dehydrogenase family)